MNTALKEKLDLARTLLEKGVELDHIRKQTLSSGVSEAETEEIMKTIKFLYYSKRRKRGFRNVFIGSFILVFGFLITLVLFHSNTSINYAMYTLTIAGAILLLWGMADIMGW